MKKINEMTELEIYNLKDEDINLMIKLRKLEEGIKLLNKPKEPDYFKIPEKDKIVYKANGFEIEFESLEELNKVLSTIKECKTACRTDYRSDYNNKFITNLNKRDYDKWDTINSQDVYSKELYNQVDDQLKQNKKLKEQYDIELKEYNSYLDSVLYIESEINDKIYEIKQKYYKLESYCRKFKYDYLPLSSNEEIAMKYMDKAYSLTQEQQEYILNNYKEII